MRVTCITGPSGAGRSRLLAEAQRHARIACFDCLDLNAASWVVPDPLACDAVAIDHFHSRGSNPVVDQAAAWCLQHDKPLWLAENLRSDLDATGYCNKKNTVEFDLSNLQVNHKNIPDLSAALWHLVPVYQSLMAFSTSPKKEGDAANGFVQVAKTTD